MKKELGIYVHIPFCKKKCYYCDFVSYPCNDFSLKINEYIETVKKEIESYDFSKYNITTIYIGGGTPSCIEPKYIAEILETIQIAGKINLKNSISKIETTIEVNPGTVTKEKLKMYQSSGINRLSIGLQTTNNKLLKQIGRIHTYEEFIETYNMARSLEFKNINIDLIIGIPNQTIADIQTELEEVIKLNPEHISTYSLIIEENTPLETMISEGKYKLPSEELERKMYWEIKNTLEQKGYIQYEISNFAKEGKESKHNCNCWKQKEYIGFGLAAHSYLNKTRYANINNIENYIKDYKTKEILETQTKEDEQKEYMLLGLRMLEGVSCKQFKEKFGQVPFYFFEQELNKLENEKLIETTEDKIKLTRKGLDLANLVWREFV